MLAIWMAISAALAGECSVATRAEQVQTAVDEALLAYATLDEDGFGEAAANAEKALPCVSDVVSPSRAAAFHRVKGLQAFLAGDVDAAQRDFGAAAAIEPDYKFSAKIAPEGGKLFRLYDEASEAAVSKPEAFTVPRGPKAYVNGTPGNQRVLEQPVIVQLSDSAGAVWYTSWIAGGTPVPELVGPDDRPLVGNLGDPEEPVVRDNPPKSTIEREPKDAKGGKTPVWAATATSGAVALGLFGTSAAMRSSFDKDPSPGKFHATNGTYYGAVGMGVLTLGLATVALTGDF